MYQVGETSKSVTSISVMLLLYAVTGRVAIFWLPPFIRMLINRRPPSGQIRSRLLHEVQRYLLYIAFFCFVVAVGATTVPGLSSPYWQSFYVVGVLCFITIPAIITFVEVGQLYHTHCQHKSVTLMLTMCVV